MNNIQTIFFLSLAENWHGLCRLLFSLCSRTPCCETTDTGNMEFDNIANEKIRRNSTNTWRASSRRDTTKVSSCLASPDAPISDGWRRWVARGLPHFGGSLRRGRWQAAAAILSCHRRRRSDPEEPAGAEGEGPGCERRLLLRVHVDALSGDE